MKSYSLANPCAIPSMSLGCSRGVDSLASHRREERNGRGGETEIAGREINRRADMEGRRRGKAIKLSSKGYRSRQEGWGAATVSC